MRSATSIAVLALLVAPALSAPLGTPKIAAVKPTSGGFGAAVAGGAASGAVGNLLNEIESFFKRGDFDNISSRDFKSTIASLSPEDKATVKAALISKVSTLKDTDLQARGVASSLGGAALGGASSALVGNLLSEIESLFRRTVEEPPVEEEPSTGSQIAGAAVGGASGAVVSNLLNKIEGFFGFKRGLFNEEVAKRDLASIKAGMQGLSAADKAKVKAALISKVSTLKDSDLKTRGVASSLGGAALGGASSALVGNLLSEIESLFRRTVEEPPVEEPTTSTPAKSGGSSTGSDLLGAAVGGASGAAVGNILDKIEGFFGFKRGVFDEQVARRDLASIKAGMQGLSAADKAKVKAALISKVSTLKNSNSARGVAGSLGAAAAGGAASGLVGNLLSEIESLFRRDGEDIARRGFSLGGKTSTSSSGSGIGSAVVGGAASAAVGNLLGEIESLFRRSEPEARGVASSLGGAALGGASSALVGNLLSEIESLFRRSDPEARDFKSTIASLSPEDKTTVKTALINKISTLKDSDLQARGVASSLGGAALGGASSALVGNLLSEIESLFRRDDEGLSRRFSLADGATKAAGGLIGAGTNAGVSGLLDKIESLFRRSEFESRDFKSTIASLSPEDKATVKAALINKVSTLKDSDLQARGVASSLGGAALGGASSALVGNLLSEIESLFRREDVLARSDMWNVNELD